MSYSSLSSFTLIDAKVHGRTIIFTKYEPDPVVHIQATFCTEGDGSCGKTERKIPTYLLSWELQFHQGCESSAGLIFGCVGAEDFGVVEEEAMDWVTPWWRSNG